MHVEYRIRSIELARGHLIFWLERRVFSGAPPADDLEGELLWFAIAGSFSRDLLENYLASISGHELPPLPEGVFAPS
ncbi:MAG TPA: hypothetical protein VEI97_20695 [bacterium]|nr:hypothetical protein [bacterium]